MDSDTINITHNAVKGRNHHDTRNTIFYRSRRAWKRWRRSARSNSRIDPALYRKYDVKRGLRDINGQGVLAGLTNISDIISRREIGGEIVPCEGELYYRGIRIQDLVQGFIRDGRKGYEEVAYLLLFGELPDAKSLGNFKALRHRDARCRPISRAMLS